MTQPAPQAKHITQVQSTYLKATSLDFPSSPHYFPVAHDALLTEDLTIKVLTRELKPGLHEVAVSAVQELKRAGQRVSRLEVVQAGVFNLEALDAQEIPRALQLGCAPVVFAHLRLSFADIANRAGMPPAFLPDVDWTKAGAVGGDAPPEAVQASTAVSKV